MDNKRFNMIFDKVALRLPFSYGTLAASQNQDGGNKCKMKKRNLRGALKLGYKWGSYRIKSFVEWRAEHDYTDDWCDKMGLKKNSLFDGKSENKKISADILPASYENYRMHFYIDHRQVNEKCADIQAFNCIADLIAENEALQKQNEKMEREVAQLKG
jgi:hypothetical protein